MRLEDCQKMILRVLSAGYEMRDGKWMDAGSQMINGKWWNPKWGCDSIDKMLDQLSYELSKHNVPVEAGKSSLTGLVCCFCQIADDSVEIATTGTPMHRQCLRKAALGELELSLLPNSQEDRATVSDTVKPVVRNVPTWVCATCGHEWDNDNRPHCIACGTPYRKPNTSSTPGELGPKMENK
jgi:hypothetical protein